MTKLPSASRLRKTAVTLALLLALTLLASQSVPAQTFTSLHDFTGGNDGGTPAGVLTMDRAGNLYGTTTDGAVLVRPDGFVAWRAPGTVPDPAGTLRQVLGAVLRRG